MGRVPRKNMKDSSFFHIMVQGLNKEYIFDTKRNMKKYHEYAYKNSENIDILAYCLMNNHAHFLIYSNEIKNIGNWMKKTNTSYALYYNKKRDRVGYVFRDRYKSQVIDNEKYLYTCAKYIHENPLKAKICKNLKDYEFSSFVGIYKCSEPAVYEHIRRFIKNKESQDLINFNEEYRKNESDDKFELLENEEIDKQFICKSIIRSFLNNNKINLRDLKFEKALLKELVETLKIKNGISYREIERNIGINKESLRKIIKNGE